MLGADFDFGPQTSETPLFESMNDDSSFYVEPGFFNDEEQTTTDAPEAEPSNAASTVDFDFEWGTLDSVYEDTLNELPEPLIENIAVQSDMFNQTKRGQLKDSLYLSGLTLGIVDRSQLTVNTPEVLDGVVQLESEGLVNMRTIAINLRS